MTRPIIAMSVTIFSIAQLYGTDKAPSIHTIGNYISEHPYKALGTAAALYGTKKALESQFARQLSTTAKETFVPFNLSKYTTISEIRAGQPNARIQYTIAISYHKERNIRQFAGYFDSTKNAIQSLISKYNTTITYHSAQGYTNADLRSFNIIPSLKNDFLKELTPEEILLYYAIYDAPNSDYHIEFTIVHNDIHRTLPPVTITSYSSSTINNKRDFVNQIYEQIIQPRILNKNIYTVRDIPEPENIESRYYTCILTPYSLAEYYLGKGLKSTVLKQLPSAIAYPFQPGITLSDYYINKIKDKFLEWTEYMYTYKNNDEVRWNIYPSYTMRFQTPVDHSYDSASYVLQPEQLSFGKHNLSSCYQQIQRHFQAQNAINMLTNYNQGLQSYEDLKNVQSILKETINIGLQIPDAFYLITNMAYISNQQLKQAIDQEIPIYKNQNTLFLITNDQNQYQNYTNYNTFFNNLLTLCRQLINDLQQQVILSTKTSLCLELLNILETHVNAIAQREPFELMHEVITRFQQNNAEFMRKNPSLYASMQNLLRKITEIFNVQNQNHFTLQEFKDLVNRIAESDTTSFIETGKMIFKQCSLTYIPHIHNYMKLPQSLFEFIDGCKRSTDAHNEQLQEKYFEVIFDLYIAPLFT